MLLKCFPIRTVNSPSVKPERFVLFLIENLVIPLTKHTVDRGLVTMTEPLRWQG